MCLFACGFLVSCISTCIYYWVVNLHQYWKDVYNPVPCSYFGIQNFRGLVQVLYFELPFILLRNKLRILHVRTLNLKKYISVSFNVNLFLTDLLQPNTSSREANFRTVYRPSSYVNGIPRLRQPRGLLTESDPIGSPLETSPPRHCHLWLVEHLTSRENKLTINCHEALNWAPLNRLRGGVYRRSHRLFVIRNTDIWLKIHSRE